MRKTQRNVIFFLAVAVVIVLVSYDEPPISMMGGEVKNITESEEELEDALIIITPKDAFPKSPFFPLQMDFGKPVVIREFSDKEIVEKLSQHIRVDVVAYRNDSAHKIFSRGLMQRLDLTRIDNLQEEYLELPFARWAGYKTGGGPPYAIPYLVRTSGILLNTSIIQSRKISWDIFWESKLKSRIGTDSLRDLVYIAALLENVPFSDIAENTENTLGIIKDRCKRLLNNGLIIYDDEKKMLKDLENEKIDVLLATEHVAENFIKNHSGFSFIAPSEGMIGWVYSLCIPVRIKDKEESYRLLNKMFNPTFAAEIFKENGDLVLVGDTENNLDQENKDMFFEQKEHFNSLIIFGNLGRKAQEKLDTFLSELK